MPLLFIFSGKNLMKSWFHRMDFNIPPSSIASHWLKVGDWMPFGALIISIPNVSVQIDVIHFVREHMNRYARNLFPMTIHSCSSLTGVVQEMGMIGCSLSRSSAST